MMDSTRTIIDLSHKSHSLRTRNRSTNVTDTVLGIGVETTSVAEEAIEKGRSVEFYVTDDDKRGMLGTRILHAFRIAHSRGMFQSRLGQEACIGPKALPSGLPRSTVTPRVTQLLQTAQEQGEGGRLSACFKVAQTIAKDSNYELKGELDRARAELLPKKRRRASSKANDIPVWGELVVYTSPNEAKTTLGADEVDEQYVRLIQVADNAQLRLMLEAGVELCGGDA